MKKILVGFEWYPCIEVEGELYIKLDDLPKITKHLALERIGQAAHKAADGIVVEVDRQLNYINLRIKGEKE